MLAPMLRAKLAKTNFVIRLDASPVIPNGGHPQWWIRACEQIHPAVDCLD